MTLLLLFINCGEHDITDVFQETMNKQTRVVNTEPMDTSEKNFSTIYAHTTDAIQVTFTNDLYTPSITSYSFALCSIENSEVAMSELENLYYLRTEIENSIYLKELHSKIKDILEEINAGDTKTWCSPPIKGSIEIQKNILTFSPTKELEHSKTYLILISDIIDNNLIGVMPYFGSFKTAPSGNTPEVETIQDLQDPSEEIQEADTESIINENDLIINEILADPPDGNDGDANQDGIRSSSEDEFIEIYNTQNHAIDLSRIKIAVGKETTIKHEWETGQIIPAKSFIVLFSGGTPIEKLNNTKTFVSNKSLSLSNSGSSIFILSNETVINKVTYGSEAGKNQSLTRASFSSPSLVLHSEVYPNILFSPGYVPQ